MSKEITNLKREIKTLKGETYPMSYPSKSDLEKIKSENGDDKVKIEDLPRETVQNVILNALANYDPEDKKEVFMINQVASWVMQEPEDGDSGELKEKLYKFLTNKVLPYVTVMKKVEKFDDEKEEKQSPGIYMAWVIAQVYDELGVTEE